MLGLLVTGGSVGVGVGDGSGFLPLDSGSDLGDSGTLGLLITGGSVGAGVGDGSGFLPSVI